MNYSYNNFILMQESFKEARASMSGQEYGDYLIAMMPENLRTGSLITKPGDL
jgi:hypothetical protein